MFIYQHRFLWFAVMSMCFWRAQQRYTPTPGVVAAVATVARVKAMQRLQDPYGINQSSRTWGEDGLNVVHEMGRKGGHNGNLIVRQ